VRLDEAERELLARARIGMLTIGAARPPLVNPAAFHFGGGSLWMTTSRHATKLALARRDPRAAFLVTPPPPPRAGGGGPSAPEGGHNGAHGVLLQGLLETFDPLSLGGQVRAIAQGPRVGLGLAGYAIKNAAYIGGYLLDLARIPAEWWPQNRVLLRLRPDRVQLVPGLDPPAAAPERVPGPPAQVATALARQRAGQLCWLAAGRPLLASAAWALDEPDAVVWLPPGTRAPRADALAALVVERHHPYRPTRVLGACLRGRLERPEADRSPLDRRYAAPLPADGMAFRLAIDRVTWWRGFEVHTARAMRPAAARVR
jgi:hypothetical protein